VPGKRVVLGADHAGADYKAILMADLASLGYSLTDCGVAPGTARADYPPVAAEVAGLVAGKGGDFGILICGTGVGMAIAANKVAGARAANCHTELSARYSRAHNDANLLTLGARIIGTELALAIARAFLAEPFQGGRHQARLDMIPGAYAP
jgi:RpiB/LacA/LacB family sugar-phosphate isomerase